jgi:hypothetical protein
MPARSEPLSQFLVRPQTRPRKSQDVLLFVVSKPALNLLGSSDSWMAILHGSNGNITVERTPRTVMCVRLESANRIVGVAVPAI